MQELVIVVDGGVVTDVFGPKNLDLTILDYDNLKENNDQEEKEYYDKTLEFAEKNLNQIY